MSAPDEDGPDTVNERYTFGGPGPEGQPDTVVEDPTDHAVDPSVSEAEPVPEPQPEPVPVEEPAQPAEPEAE